MGNRVDVIFFYESKYLNNLFLYDRLSNISLTGWLSKKVGPNGYPKTFIPSSPAERPGWVPPRPSEPWYLAVRHSSIPPYLSSLFLPCSAQVICSHSMGYSCVGRPTNSLDKLVTNQISFFCFGGGGEGKVTKNRY